MKRESVKKQRSEVQKQKDAFMEEVNSYNKSKSEIDTNLSMHQQKFDVAHSNITTSEKRLLFINTRLPELSESLETLNHERVLIEFQIANLKEKILKQREQRNILNNESKTISDQRSDVLKKQSQITTQKHDVDKKIERLRSKITHVKLVVGKLDGDINDLNEKILSNLSLIHI